MSNDSEKAIHLSHVLQAVQTAPEGVDTGELQAYLSKHKIGKKEQDDMLERGCTDAGACLVAMTRPAAPKKKAAAKK